VVLAALVLGTVYWLPVGFVVVVTVAFLVAVAELVTVLAQSGYHPPRVPLLLGTVAMCVSAYAGGIGGLTVAFTGTVLCLLFWRLPGVPEGAVRDITSGVWVAAYAPFMAGFALLLFAQTQGADRIVVYIATTAASDIGGYASGVLLGKHPMAPGISPKKTWEGFAGSVVACVLVGAGTSHQLLGLHWWQGAVVGLAVVVTATMGDLAESMVKRDLGVKDMGRILPGHGGLMDRLDSLIPVAPVAFVLLTAFAGS
jgi:phosphatidate cytidylyltransferase